MATVQHRLHQDLLVVAKATLQDAMGLPPRQARLQSAFLRRSFSTLYYSLFHFVVTNATHYSIGATRQNNLGWYIATRQVEHRRVLEVCKVFKEAYNRGNAPFSNRHFHPTTPQVHQLCVLFIDLYEQRIKADYDHDYAPSLFDAQRMVSELEAIFQTLDNSNFKKSASFFEFSTCLVFKDGMKYLV